jgi:23S rRNA (cytosine1962-C5)-methyltransferase
VHTGPVTPRPIDLDALSRPGDRRLALRVTADAARHIAAGHPWVYDESITSVSHEGAPGDLAVVFGRDREFLAVGLWDPASPIRLKVLHHGRPRIIDPSFWAARLDTAVARRVSVVDRGDTTGYRVVHGENDGFPGLVVDRYDSTLVVKAYTAAWVPHLRDLVPALVDRTAAERVVLRSSRTAGLPSPLDEPVALVGTMPVEPVPFLEHGLHFEADVVHGQKTGHFLDQRDNRVRVGRASQGADVLDVFACTGGFSVHAAAGGATSVTSVDLSEAALATASRNMARNRDRAAVRRCRHVTVQGDAFDVMARFAREERRYDVVVVDPPSFAQRQSSVDRAVAAYGRLARLAVALVAPGGLLLAASCSSRVDVEQFTDAVRAGARAGGRRLDVVEVTGHGIDHPIGFTQGAYLKAVVARVP